MKSISQQIQQQAKIAAGAVGVVNKILVHIFLDSPGNRAVESSGSGYVRMTGYLIRCANLETKREEKILRHDSSLLGTEFIAHQENTLHRRVRKVEHFHRRRTR